MSLRATAHPLHNRLANMFGAPIFFESANAAGPQVPCPIRERMFTALRAMECANPGFRLELGLLDDWERDHPGDWGRRARRER